MWEDTRVNLYLAERDLVGKCPVPYGVLYFSAHQVTTGYPIAGAGEKPVQTAGNRYNDESGRKDSTNYIPRLLFAHYAS